jgi:hypothetical protein
MWNEKQKQQPTDHGIFSETDNSCCRGQNNFKLKHQVKHGMNNITIKRFSIWTKIE